MSSESVSGRPGPYVAAIAVGAFLLFLVQPLVARTLLPEFGGSPAVWTACMLFFQMTLLLGYAYAHVLSTRARPRTQSVVHAALLVVAVAHAAWVAVVGVPRPPAEGALGVLLQVLVLVGPAFFALSATAPLAQAWFASDHPGRSPYPLYAVSNAGSLLALLAYPLALEPWTGLAVQRVVWTIGLVVFAALMAACGVRAGRLTRSAAQASDPGTPAPPWIDRALWMLLPCATSILLLAVTNEISQNIAVIPFLWLAPLALYLLSYVLAFGNAYSPTLFRPLALLCVLLLGRTSWSQLGASFGLDLMLWCGALFVLCTACHGEAARLRPVPSRLTSFYLSLSAGGALGGLFAGIVAPAVFDSLAELWIGVVGCIVLLVACAAREANRRADRRHARGRAALMAAGAVAILGVLLGIREPLASVERRRSFYGVLDVVEYGGEDVDVRALHHGSIAHGAQLSGSIFRFKPIAYYGHGTAVEAVFAELPKRRERRIGVLGLGIGTVAAYSEPGDTVRFYEIDDDVVELARRHFTYLRDAAGEVTIAVGDGRAVLAAEEDRDFDVLLVDAFSGASPPSHLLTLEAFRVYVRHLAPGGVLLVNVSNSHFDLVPPVLTAARELGLRAAVLENDEIEGHETYAATWVAMTRDLLLLDNPAIRELEVETLPGDTTVRWTDDAHSLLPLVLW